MHGNEKAKIFVAEPDEGMRDAIGEAAALGGFAIADYANIERLLHDVVSGPPVAAFISFEFRSNGLAVSQIIRSEAPAVQIFMTSAYHQSPKKIAEAMLIGARDCFCAPLNPMRLQKALSILSRPSAAIEERSAKAITPRERQVLNLVAQGRTNKQIGSDLGISFRTAQVHRQNAMSKLGAENTADLVRIFLTSRTFNT